MENNLRKGAVIGILFLFIGLTIIPNINGKFNNSNKNVKTENEFPSQILGSIKGVATINDNHPFTSYIDACLFPVIPRAALCLGLLVFLASLFPHVKNNSIIMQMIVLTWLGASGLIMGANGAQCDANGNFEIKYLRPGIYFLFCVNTSYLKENNIREQLVTAWYSVRLGETTDAVINFVSPPNPPHPTQ